MEDKSEEEKLDDLVNYSPKEIESYFRGKLEEGQTGMDLIMYAEGLKGDIVDLFEGHQKEKILVNLENVLIEYRKREWPLIKSVFVRTR